MVRYKDVADQLAAAPAPAVDADAALGVGSVAVVCAEFDALVWFYLINS